MRGMVNGICYCLLSIGYFLFSQRGGGAASRGSLAN